AVLRRRDQVRAAVRRDHQAGAQEVAVLVEAVDAPGAVEEELHQVLPAIRLSQAGEQLAEALGPRGALLGKVADLAQHRVRVDERLPTLRGRRAEREQRRTRGLREWAERLRRAGDRLGAGM